jgi:hypothetical protein
MPFDMPDSYEHCGAKTRNGTPCKAPKVKGRSRCRKHGGSTPRGATSPHFQHGFYSQDQRVRQFWKTVERVYQHNLRNERTERFLAEYPMPRSSDYPSVKAYRKAGQNWQTAYMLAMRRLETDIVNAQDAQGIYAAYCAELGTEDFFAVYMFAVWGVR